MGLDTRNDPLTDRQSQCGFDFGKAGEKPDQEIPVLQQI
jgi:hypothetical protein